VQKVTLAPCPIPARDDMILIMSNRISDVFAAMAAPSRAVAAGASLFCQGDPVANMYLVVEGRVDLVRHSAAGGVIVLQRAGPGDIVAEASLFSDRYHCDAVAATPASVRSVARRRFRDRLRADADFAEAWMAHLGQEIQTMRLRGEVLSLPTVAARLDAWLAWHDRMPPKGEWKQLAHQIGVSPEALYREMARRRD